MSAQVMNLFHHPFGIRITGSVEAFLTPKSVFPSHPVLNHIIQRNVSFPILFHNRNQFFRSLIALFGLTIAKHPFGKKRGFSCELSVAFEHLFIRTAADKVEIQFIHQILPDIRTVAVILKGHHRAAVEEESISFCRDKRGNTGFHILLIDLTAFSYEISVSLFV